MAGDQSDGRALGSAARLAPTCHLPNSKFPFFLGFAVRFPPFEIMSAKLGRSPVDLPAQGVYRGRI